MAVSGRGAKNDGAEPSTVTSSAVPGPYCTATNRGVPAAAVSPVVVSLSWGAVNAASKVSAKARSATERPAAPSGRNGASGVDTDVTAGLSANAGSTCAIRRSVSVVVEREQRGRRSSRPRGR